LTRHTVMMEYASRAEMRFSTSQGFRGGEKRILKRDEDGEMEKYGEDWLGETERWEMEKWKEEKGRWRGIKTWKAY